MELILIAAMAANRVIGCKNHIPWDIPGEQTRFKEITMGHSLIMGRKTWHSIGRPLPGRQNIVLTKDLNFKAVG
ncbi:MAG: dihydrofolate reductase, partial [Candidatus Electrothrix sp. AR3]|nr:dihydrofolate reductase [Candidatus Electrothrix sp. AR3]